MSQIDAFLTTTPPADGIRPELPASGESGGEAAFTQLLHSACCAATPATATDSPPPEGAAMAELLRQGTAADGKDLPPLTAERLLGMTGTGDADKLPDTVVPDTATPASMPSIAGPMPLTPPVPAATVTSADMDIPAAGVPPEATPEAVKTTAVSDTKPLASPAMPPAAEVKQQPGAKFDAAAIEVASQQPSGTDRQTAISPLAVPAAEPVAAERLARVTAAVDAPVSVQAPLDAVRQLANAMPDTASRMSSSVTAPIPVPPDHPQWGQTFGERVVWLVNQHATSAQLSLNPPDLGRLDVQINLNQDQARVLFAASHESVREAIEAAVPRLREMLADSGVQLLDVGIERHAGGRQPHPFQAPAPTPGRADAAATPAAEAPAPQSGAVVGLVDYFI